MGGVLPYKRLMEMSRWMGSHFYDRIDYNGVAFTIEGDKTGIAIITYLPKSDQDEVYNWPQNRL